LKAVECAKVTGEPIVRSMEFVFPGQGMERVMDQFMVGEDLLVAPVWKQGEVARSVRLPEGQWRCVGLGETEGDVLNGGRDVILGENEGLVVLKRV
jgi:alpha-glucosidase (family GH31 glycosyl hydrolase)